MSRKRKKDSKDINKNTNSTNENIRNTNDEPIIDKTTGDNSGLNDIIDDIDNLLPDEDIVGGDTDSQKNINISEDDNLPPREFYELIKNASLPRGYRLSKKMIDILDKLYSGISRKTLWREMGYPKSTISVAVTRLRMLYDLYSQGMLDIGHDIPKTTDTDKIVKGGVKKSPSTLYLRTQNTTTFLEIDRTIAGMLRPQIERSMQFQDTMAKIGQLTAFSLLQMGLIDQTRFVKLSEIVTEDPSHLYNYVASGLNILINMVSPEKARRLTEYMMFLRGENIAMKVKIEELESKLATYERWIEEAKAIMILMYDMMPASLRRKLLTKLAQVYGYSMNVSIVDENGLGGVVSAKREDKPTKGKSS